MESLTPSPLVKSLLDPKAYPEEVGSVELVETHISHLFLTGSHVYKVKKSVNFGFLDFTTLEKRRDYCNIEVELNRRLSPEVYLGVVEVRQVGDEFSIGGTGEVVDYAVKMLQLPRDREMKHLLENGLVTEADVNQLAAKIAKFHAGAETSPEITSLGNWDAVSQNVAENFQQTETFVGRTISLDQYDDLQAYSLAFLEKKKNLFDQRAEAGRIRDCHGDLHSAQIFLLNGISIIDCIEFNTRFRYSDVAEDIAFLAMDLDFYHRPDLSQVFIHNYVEQSGDQGVVPLLDFFKAYRAYVRGKVTSFRLDESQVSEEETTQVIEMARAYFQLAHSYVKSSQQRSLFLVVGLTGTGKSTVAQELTRRWDLTYFSTDITRKKLAEVPLEEHRYEDYQEGIYSPEFSSRVYLEMLDEADRGLAEGRSVVLDGTFRGADQRRIAADIAGKHGAGVWVIECVLTEEEVKRRLDLRVEGGNSVSDGRWEIYEQQRQTWEQVQEVPQERHIVLDTSKPIQVNVQEIIFKYFCNVL